MRVASQRSGAPRRRAAWASSNSSGPMAALPPNAPPTSGATTCTLSDARPRESASIWRARLGVWVAHQASKVSAPAGPDQCISAARGSSGAGATRGRLMRTRAVGGRAGKVPLAQPTWASGVAGSDRPCAGMSAVAGPSPAGTASSMLTSTASAALRAAAALCATTRASGAPTAAARPAPSRLPAGSVSGCISGFTGGRARPGRSASVNTATTPGRARAASVCRAVTRPPACMLRTNTACSRPGGARSAMNWPAPHSRRASSRRSRPAVGSVGISMARIESQPAAWLKRHVYTLPVGARPADHWLIKAASIGCVPGCGGGAA